MKKEKKLEDDLSIADENMEDKKIIEWERESYIDKIYAGLKKYMNISKNIMNEKEKREYKSWIIKFTKNSY